MPTRKDRRSAKRSAKVHRRRVTAKDLTPAPVPRRRRRRSPEEEAVVAQERERLRIEREKAMLNASVLKVDVLRLLEARGTTLSHVTIGAVIAGRHRNADVEAAFCELTKTETAVMFPAAESPTHNNATSA